MTSALLRHAWWSIRGRALASALAVSAHAVAMSVLFARFAANPGAIELTPADQASLDAGTYGGHVIAAWAGGSLATLLTIIGVALAVGGVPAERRDGTAELTLSLPVPRVAWLAARASLVMAILLVLAAGSALVVGTAALATGNPAPLTTFVAAAALAAVVPAYAVALAIFATTITRGGITAALATLLLVYALSGLGAAPSGWAPDALQTAAAWRDALPWRALFSWTAVTAVAGALAARRFTHMDA